MNICLVEVEMVLLVYLEPDQRQFDVKEVAQTVINTMGRTGQPAEEAVVEATQEVFVDKAKQLLN